MLDGLNHITIAVSDLDKSFDFYTQMLGMTPHVRWNRGAYLSLGGTWFCLSCDTPKPSQDYSHIALSISEENFFLFVSQLRAAGVTEWKENKSEGQSAYFLDPDGHKLEAHCGTLASRLAALRENSYQGLVWLN